jgi:hypothetical protein
MKKYYILIFLVLGTTFSWQANAQNGGDNCASAVTVSAETIVQTEINDLSGGINGGDSAWFVYTPSESGYISVSSCLGGSDTNLHIWNDCADAGATISNDDACPFAADGSGNNYASEIVGFMVVADEDYYIQWDDRWNENPFDWELTFVEIGFNDTCQTALEVTCNSSIDGTTLDKTDTNGIGGPDAFYKFTELSPEAREVIFSLCTDFDYDTFMRIYTDCNGTLVSENDDTCNLGSEITLTTMPGATYYIAIEGYNGNTGTFKLTVDCAAPPMPPPNDNIVNAIDIDVVDYLDENVNTQYATEEGGNPTNCSVDGFEGVWYYFYSAEGGTSTTTIVTPGGVNSVIYFEANNDNPSIEELIRVDDVQNPCFTGTQSSINLVPEKYYFLFITNSGNLTDIQIETDVILSTEDALFKNFSFFPNPTTDTLTLKNTTEIKKIVLRNMLGAKVLEEEIKATEATVETQHLATGSYILSVYTDGLGAQYHVLKK